eukprot:118231-Rhodomonas_salina.1
MECFTSGSRRSWVRLFVVNFDLRALSLTGSARRRASRSRRAAQRRWRNLTVASPCLVRRCRDVSRSGSVWRGA